MHPRTRLAVGLVAALAASGLAAPPPASAADARSGTTLHGFGDIVVDATHGHVLVSQSSGGPIVVVSPTGERLGTISGTSGAGDLWLSDDQSTLLAAYSSRRIDVIDASTLAVTDSYDTVDCAGAVAQLGSTVFYGGPCPNSTGPSELYALDPASGESTQVGDVSSPELMTNPAWPDSLFVAETDSGYPRIWRFTWHPDPDGPDGPEEAALVREATRRSHFSARFAFLPGGQQLVTAQGDILSADTLDLVSHYQDIGRPSVAGVAVGDDGTVGFTSNRTDRTVTTYAPDHTKPWHRYDFSNTRDVFARGASLAFSSSTMFVTTDADPYHSNHLHLRAIPIVGPSHLTLRLDRARYRCGQKARLRVRLTGPTHERSVRLFARTPHGGNVHIGDWELGGTRRGVLRFTATQTWTFQAVLLDPDDQVVAERRLVVKPRCR